MADVANGKIWTRELLEFALGFPLNYYRRRVTDRSLEFGFGYDRLGPGAGQWVDYDYYGLRRSAVSENVLEGYEAEDWQETRDTPRWRWVRWLRFERVAPVLPADLGAESGDALEPPLRRKER